MGHTVPTVSLFRGKIRRDISCIQYILPFRFCQIARRKSYKLSNHAASFLIFGRRKKPFYLFPCFFLDLGRFFLHQMPQMRPVPVRCVRCGVAFWCFACFWDGLGICFFQRNRFLSQKKRPASRKSLRFLRASRNQGACCARRNLQWLTQTFVGLYEQCFIFSPPFYKISRSEAETSSVLSNVSAHAARRFAFSSPTTGAASGRKRARLFSHAAAFAAKARHGSWAASTFAPQAVSAVPSVNPAWARYADSTPS